MAKYLAVLLLLLVAHAGWAQEEDRIISPSATAVELREESQAASSMPETPSAGVVLAYLVLLGAGAGFLLMRQRKNSSRRFGIGNKQGIDICGSRMLGNRQHLLVVEVDGQRVLLGVGPGFINHLTNLLPSSSTEAANKDTAPDGEPIVDLPPVKQGPELPFPLSTFIRRLDGLNRRDEDGKQR